MLAALLMLIAPPLALMAIDAALDQAIPPADDFWGEAVFDDFYGV